jgi:hypothetical protein
MWPDDEFLFSRKHLKPECKEHKHFYLVDDQLWQYLHRKYGGIDLPRLSIETAPGIFEVEVRLRLLKIVSFPRVLYVKHIQTPMSVLISVKDTVKKLHVSACSHIVTLSDGKFSAC